MKALSAAQTMFLKAYLSGKISSAATLIEDTLKLIESKGASGDPQLNTIRSNLAALKVHELEVWYPLHPVVPLTIRLHRLTQRRRRAS